MNPFINLPPITAETPVEDVKQRIRTELSLERQRWLNNWEAKKAEIYTTAEYAKQGVRFNGNDPVKIGPSVIGQLFILAIVCPFGGTTLMTAFPNFTPPTWIVITTSYILGFAIYLSIPSLHRKIRIGSSGIEMPDEWFDWNDMIGTYAVHINESFGQRYQIKSLFVIIKKDGDPYIHEFRNLSISLKKFCAIVEHFRNRTPLVS